MQDRISREPEVRRIFGYGSPRTTYDMVARGLLPPPVKVGPRAVGWPLSEVNALFAARVAGAKDAGICALVRRLIEARTDAAAELNSLFAAAGLMLADKSVLKAEATAKRGRGRPRRVQRESFD